MPPQSVPPKESDANAKLIVNREEFTGELEERIALGEQLRERDLESEDSLAKAREDHARWDRFNLELLRRRFTNHGFADEYHPRTASVGALSDVTPPLSQRVVFFRELVGRHLARLYSILDRLSLVEKVSTKPVEKGRSMGTEVFVVHGHDEARLEQVARLLEQLDLRIVILHEKTNQGRTLIEKFEANTANAGFAVVIATGDDEGGPRNSGKFQPRARQNVVFEAGFFVGALGRYRTAILYEDGVELPSDLDGLVYIPLGGGWRLDLAKEIRAAGFQVDLNLL